MLVHQTENILTFSSLESCAKQVTPSWRQPSCSRLFSCPSSSLWNIFTENIFIIILWHQMPWQDTPGWRQHLGPNYRGFIDLESEGTGSDARPSNLKHLYQKYFHFHYRCKLLHSTPWSMDQKIWSRIRRLGGGWRLDQKGRVRCSSIKPGSSLKHLHRKYFHHHCHGKLVQTIALGINFRS